MSKRIQNKTLFVIGVILIIVMVAPVFADHNHSGNHSGNHAGNHTGQHQHHTDSTQVMEDAEDSSSFESREQEVMPFSLEETLHVFTDTDFGGIQQVIVKDKTKQEQINLIQSHLQEEATRFATGDFDDPSYLHGESMAGLKDISAAASKGDLIIQYTELIDGAEIRYESENPWTIIALHLWFQAQVNDHGGHAVSKP